MAISKAPIISIFRMTWIFEKFILLTFFLLLPHVYPTAHGQTTYPKLTFVSVGGGFENVSLPGTNTIAFYSGRYGGDMFLKCEAPYPIQWNFSGFFAPREIAKIQPPKRNLHTETFEIAVKMYFLDGQDASNIGASLMLLCEKVENPEVRNVTFIFVRGNTKMSLIEPDDTTVTDSTVIPCATKDALLPTHLYKKVDYQGEIPVDSPAVEYHPTVGFQSTEIFSGTYVCRQGTSYVTVHAKTSSPSSHDYEFYPKTSTLRVFSDKSIKFECYSKTTHPVKMVVMEDTKNVSIFYEHQKNGEILLLSSTNPVAISSKGEVVCEAYNAETSEMVSVVKAWTYEFVQAPQLLLDNYEGEINCLSQVSPKIVQSVRCANKMDCQYMAHCLENRTYCNFNKQKQFFGTRSDVCTMPNGTSMECVSVPYSHFNGVIQCKVSGLAKRWEFFVSLNYLRYKTLDDVPKEELIRMDDVEPVLYTNKTANFSCTAIAYLFADSLSFEIEFKNGTRRLLINNDDTVRISNPDASSRKKISEFNVLGVLNIMLPLDTVAITCIAPCWNSTNTSRAEKRFQTKDLMRPQILSGGNGKDSKQEVFYVGERNCRLTCSAVGEPQPEYQWYFNEILLNKTFNELNTSIGSHGEGSLDFPEIMDQKYAGVYTCRAKNRVGFATLQFKLEIYDYPIFGSKRVYILAIIAVLVILAFVLILLYVSKRKYTATKKLVRMLTDNEINEFFQGRPELLSQESGFIGTYVNLLPYKKECEISLDDLELDNPGTPLGSGISGYVIKGTFKGNQLVAIKVSKPSSDVELFKSLLSEVKIMSYIEEHPNIISLIGVYTSDIKNRMIYIVTEICELGSLDVFLLNSRTSFVNIINANQAIDLSLLPHYINQETHLSTLDLIAFSQQIATGMEFLAYNKVIHADLAARNILLTKQRTVKISDFGLSRKLYALNDYVKKSAVPLPWRWMAMESLTTLTFSTYSDVWSYGVTLFEIFTLGDKPFPNEQWNSEFVKRVSDGMRMGRPKYSTQEIYSKIMTCWEYEPELRPTFTSLRAFFEQILSRHLNRTLDKTR